MMENVELLSIALPQTATSERTGQRVAYVCVALLWGFIGSYVVLMLLLCFRLYNYFALFAYDLGIYDQGTWLLSRGQSPFVTVRGMPLFADHLRAENSLHLPPA
jgi:uncharacterized membrane protein